MFLEKSKNNTFLILIFWILSPFSIQLCCDSEVFVKRDVRKKKRKRSLTRYIVKDLPNIGKDYYSVWKLYVRLFRYVRSHVWHNHLQMGKTNHYRNLIPLGTFYSIKNLIDIFLFDYHFSEFSCD